MAVDGASEEEEESGDIEATLNNLIIKMVGREKEAAEQLEAVLKMEVEETGKVEGESDGNRRSLGAL